MVHMPLVVQEMILCKPRRSTESSSQCRERLVLSQIPWNPLRLSQRMLGAVRPLLPYTSLPAFVPLGRFGPHGLW